MHIEGDLVASVGIIDPAIGDDCRHAHLLAPNTALFPLLYNVGLRAFAIVMQRPGNRLASDGLFAGPCMPTMILDIALNQASCL